MRALWIAIAALALLRAALVPVPRMDLWALNVLRFVSPGVGAAVWLLAGSLLVPSVARRVERVLERSGRIPGRTWIAAAAAALLVLLLPDQVRYLGDFLLRQGSIREAARPSVVFPQALPLDVLLHHRLPLLLIETVGVEPNSVARLIGALDAAALAACAVALPSILGFTGGAAWAATAVAWFGGYLGMFTGYSKATVELTVIVAFVGACAALAVRHGRGLMRLGLGVVLGLALHRSALGLIPGLMATWIAWGRAHGRAGAWRRPGVMLAAAVPIAGVAVLAPRLLRTIAHVDLAVHIAPEEVRALGGPLAAALAGTRPADFLDLLLMLSPLALPALVAACFGIRRSSRARELAVLAVFAAPFVLAAPLLHPVQGIHRDWDNFAPAGAAISLLSACAIGDLLSAARVGRGAATAVIAGALAPTLLWLVHHADVERGLDRMRAFVTEPPERSRAERAYTWDYLAVRDRQMGDTLRAEQELARAADLAPTPRVLYEWGHVAMEVGRIDDAERAYTLLTTRLPTDARGWTMLAQVRLRQGDLAGARVALDSLRSRSPRYPAIPALEEAIERAGGP